MGRKTVPNRCQWLWRSLWDTGRVHGGQGVATRNFTTSLFRGFWADGVAQRDFLENLGFPKWAQNRPEEARSAAWSAKMSENHPPERGPEMGSKNEPKKCLKMKGFWMIKTFKSVVRSSKIKVFSFLEKASKYDQKRPLKWTPKAYKMSPKSVQGRPRVDCETSWG